MGVKLLITRILPYVGRERKKAQAVLARYEKALPEMRAFQQALGKVANKYGFVTDAFNRRYRLNKKRPYTIVAHICQGMAANVKKHALVRVDSPQHDFMNPIGGILDGKRSGVVLDIHDELVMEFYPEDAHLLADIQYAMEDWPNISVPMKVDTAIGYNLLDMKEVSIEEATEAIRTGHITA